MLRDRDPFDVQAINADASVLMKRGIALMADGRPDALADALACFDEALALRLRLPIDEVPLFRYGLAACWLNRADALARLGAARAADALRSYDEGIAVASALPLADDPRYPRRLAMAHQNRAAARLAQGATAAAAAGFTDAIAILEDDRAARVADRLPLLAACWTNLANAHASEDTDRAWTLARDAALRAVAIGRHLETADADAAEAGLKARHVLCHTIARDLSNPAARRKPTIEDVHEATDVVDEALALARRWERAGVARFRPIAYDLFRFGARLYAIHQPQFLREFVADNLDPTQSSPDYVASAEMQSAAHEALGLASPADS